MALLTQEAPSPTMFEPNLPPQLVAVIERSISKDVEARFQSIHALHAALAPFDPTNIDTSGMLPPVGSAPHLGVPPAAGSAPHMQAMGSSPQMAGHAQHGMANPHAQMANVPQAAGSHPGAPHVGTPQAGAPEPIRPTLPDAPPLDVPPVTRWIGAGIASAFLSSWLAAGGLLRAVDVDLAAAGWLIIALLVGIAVAVPGVLLLQRIQQAAAPTGPRLARHLRAAVLVGSSTYGVLSMLVRVLQIGLLSDPDNVAWPVYDVLIAMASFSAAAVTVALRKEPG